MSSMKFLKKEYLRFCDKRRTGVHYLERSRFISLNERTGFFRSTSDVRRCPVTTNCMSNKMSKMKMSKMTPADIMRSSRRDPSKMESVMQTLYAGKGSRKK